VKEPEHGLSCRHEDRVEEPDDGARVTQLGGCSRDASWCGGEFLVIGAGPLALDQVASADAVREHALEGRDAAWERNPVFP
jgi:hypothetical protein